MRAPRAAPGASINFLRRTTSGAADKGMGTSLNFLRFAAGIGLGT
jgi:hypothetical protein